MQELSFVTTMKLRQTGQVHAAKLLTEATTITPSRATRILKKWKSPDQSRSSLSAEEGVELIVPLHLTRKQYQVLRQRAKEHGHDLSSPNKNAKCCYKTYSKKHVKAY